MPTATAVTVATTATALHTPFDECGSIVRVSNTDATATLYVGDSAVTTSTGTPIAAGRSMAVPVPRGERLYGIVASSTLNARVLVSPVDL